METNRQLLKRVINGHRATPSKLRTFVVCHGERTFRDEADITSDFDITVNVHCTDPQQLELQGRPR